MGIPFGLTISLKKLVRVVTFLEAIVPGFAILLMAILQKSQADSTQESVSAIKNYHASDAVIHILNLFIFYLHLTVRIGLTILLWKGASQRSVKKLLIWCVSSAATTLIGVIPCAVMLIQKFTLGQVATTIIITLTITSAFSLTTVAVLIRKIRSGAMRDYEDYMCLRFEKREMLTGGAST